MGICDYDSCWDTSNDDVNRSTVHCFTVLHALSPSSPQQSILTAAQQFTTAPRDVLPFATALVGFAGGVVTAMYRTGTAQGPPPQSSPVTERLVTERLITERLVKERLRSREFIQYE